MRVAFWRLESNKNINKPVKRMVRFLLIARHSDRVWFIIRRLLFARNIPLIRSDFALSAAIMKFQSSREISAFVPGP